MRPVSLIAVLTLAWACITGNFDGPNLLLGAGIGVLAAIVLRRSLAQPFVFRKFRLGVSLLLLFVYELVVSALKVARVVVSPNLKSQLRPAVLAYPLSVKSDAEITLLANLITLTPGTLSLDVSEDRSVLYVHVLSLDSREVTIAGIANGFERKVKELYR